jgi:glycosyltransferase involved in cell wall biosynthesis
VHILYLHQYYCPEGGWGNDRSADFARRWVAAGHAVTVCTTTAYFPAGHAAHHSAYSEFMEHGVRVCVWRIPYAQHMGVWARARAFLRFFFALVSMRYRGADVIYASTTPPTVALAGALLSFRWRKPWVLEVVDVWPEVPVGMGLLTFAPLIWGLKAVMNFCYRSARHIVALSVGMKEQIIANGIAPERITVVENGTDVALFRPRNWFDYGKHDEPVRLIYTGALGRANAVEQLLDAAERLQTLEKPWRLDIYGDGAERGALEQRLAERPIPNVTLHRPVPKQDIPAILAQADIGVVCFAPYAVLEANSANKFFDTLAAGLPVVLNYQGWQAEVLRQTQSGLSSVQGDQDGFVQSLSELISASDLRVAMGNNARALAELHYDRKSLGQHVLGLLEAATRR